MEILTRAIGYSLGARQPSGLIVDADNSLGVTTSALLKGGYEVLSLAPPDLPDLASSEGLDAQFGKRVRIHTCVFGQSPGDLKAAPDGVIAFTETLSTLPSIEAVADALRTYFDLLRPGGTIVIAHADYDRIQATDPDTAMSTPALTGSPDNPSVFLERRIWTGHPRSPHFTAEYSQMTPKAGPTTASQQQLAIPMAVISEILGKTGFEALVWKSPEETGFRLPLVVATKPPVPVGFYAPAPLDLLVDATSTSRIESEKVKFQFYPEDMDDNPFEERPDERKPGPANAGLSTQGIPYPYTSFFVQPGCETIPQGTMPIG